MLLLLLLFVSTLLLLLLLLLPLVMEQLLAAANVSQGNGHRTLLRAALHACTVQPWHVRVHAWAGARLGMLQQVRPFIRACMHACVCMGLRVRSHTSLHPTCNIHATFPHLKQRRVRINRCLQRR